MVATAKLVIYMIAILTGLIMLGIFFVPKMGAFSRASSATDVAKEFVPNVSIGADELNAGKPTIPSEHREQILKLNKTIRKMLDSGYSNCFGNFGDFSDLGERGTGIQMVYNPTKKSTDFLIYGGEGGQQLLTDFIFSIEGMHPCVIAGSKSITENFYTEFVDWKKSKGSHYNRVNGIRIVYNTDGDNGNVIRVPELGADSVNDQDNNFENNGWLYTPDGENICFFPTNDHINFDEDGIAEEWFGDGEDNSIPKNVQKHNRLCS